MRFGQPAFYEPILRREYPMYAIAVVRYRKPLDEVLKVVEAHRDYRAMAACCSCVFLTSRPLPISTG